MKIVFVSGVKFGHEIIKTLLKNKFQIEAIFSYSKKKKKNYSDYVNYNDISKKFKIKNYEISNINDEKNIRILNKIKPDLILVMGWSQIIKKDIIKIPKIGIIGSHPTELPKYRGRAPIPWTIIKGLKQSALTFFWIEEGIDDGDIFAQKKFKISNDDDANIIYEKIILLGKEILLKKLPQIEKKQKQIKQDPKKFIEYWEKRTPDDGKINWNDSAKKIHTLIRASTNPYPGAFTVFKNKKIIIWQAKLMENKLVDPGKIMKVNKNGIIVGTGNGSIILKKVDINNKTLDFELFSKNIGNSFE